MSAEWRITARRLLAGIALVLLAVAGWWTNSAVTALADEPVKDHILDFTMTPSSTQAGGHPDLHTFLFTENSTTGHFPIPDPCDRCEDPRDIGFESPAGIVADPHAVPQCNQVDFAQVYCPIDSQIGVLEIGFNGQVFQGPGVDPEIFPVPVYNLTPHPNQPGLLGFYAPVLISPVYIGVTARTDSDYGLNLKTESITHVVSNGISFLNFKLWGIPADPSHDVERLGPTGCDAGGYGTTGAPPCKTGFSSNSPLQPFINNPTTCGIPLEATAEVVTYTKGVDRKSIIFPGTTGCDQLSFNPSLFGQPTSTATDTASGFEANLTVPQGVSPYVPAPSEIRGTAVTLPEGFSLNSSAADGKSACTDVEARIGVRDEAAQCPENSKIGTVAITSSSLPAPLPGYIYLGEPRPGARYRLILAADGFGLHVKLLGSVLVDSHTGRLTTRFDDLPQFPFSNFNLHFFGSERGLLATPVRCGTYSVDSTFTPWDSALPNQSSKQFFSLTSGPNGGPCPGSTRPFNPAFEAGVADKTAGVHAPFSLELTREDGDQNLTGLRISTPPGFAATLKGVPYCPQSAIDRLSDGTYAGLAEQSSPACPVASQVGVATAGAGAGTHPFYAPGKVYLAGPYKGAPLSLVVVIPAVSGPYDLGNVTVRAAINVDPITAQVTTVSDPLPQIVEGVLLRTRSILVSLDRPGFTLNPTNCDPLTIGETSLGSEGGNVSRNMRFQVANCADLAYEPKLNLKLTGGTRRRGHPAVRAVLKTSPGEANTHAVSVALPAGELLDNSHIGTVCTRPEFAKDACPAGSRLGTAEAVTPLLAEPLKGNVYLRASSHELPDIAIDLEGQFDVELSGRIDTTKDGALRTNFETVPDAPVSTFVLNLAGGKKGLLINGKSLCGKKSARATVRMTGQNNTVVKRKTSLNPSCGAATQGKRHRRRTPRTTGGTR